MNLGGGGGGGGTGNTGGGPNAGTGGRGGGIIVIASATTSASGVIDANGNAGGNSVHSNAGGGGGGAGGSILIRGQMLTFGSSIIVAAGDSGGTNGGNSVGGAGGTGRIRVEYCQSISGGIANPPASVQQILCNDSDADGYGDPQQTLHLGPTNTTLSADNCPSVANPTQLNTDGNYIDNLPPYGVDDKTRIDSDELGDACDPDDDNDGISDADEATGATCAGKVTNPLLEDTDGDRVLDRAECVLGKDPTNSANKPTLVECGIPGDADHDRISDRIEFCYYDSNPLSADSDGDMAHTALDGAHDGCEVASYNPDNVVNVADAGILASGIVGGATWYQPNIDFNKDGALNIADSGLLASFRSPSGQCPLLPDLSVTFLAIELQTGGSCNYTSTQLGVRVTLFNNGGTAGAFSVDANGVQQLLAPGMLAGAVTSMWFAGYVPFVSQNAFADIGNVISESNEANNGLSQFAPIPTLPPTCTPTASPTFTATATTTPTATPVP